MLPRFVCSFIVFLCIFASDARIVEAGKPYGGVPLAFQLFCLKHPGECRKSGQDRIGYTPSVRRLLSSVNAEVNRAIRPRREKRDVWTLNPAAGDCDDYVVSKRHRLINAGLPASALKIAVVRTRSGEGHAILLVTTDAGDFALDNLRGQIVRRNRTGYRFISVSAGHL